jgi:NAD(P)-dependent dehydrogenase (short-subunit alcohol dehydrogenase family)
LDAAVGAIGAGTVALQSDVSELEDIDRLFSVVESKLGKIDVLFANAGIAKFAPYSASQAVLFEELFATNVKGVYFTLQKALPHLNDGASVILNTSVLASKGTENMGSMRPQRRPCVPSAVRPPPSFKAGTFGSTPWLRGRLPRPFSGAPA